MDKRTPMYVISVAAELADMHPQTLRQYDRMGLVSPSRQGGRQRRYSRQDVETLREIQRLSKDGVSLEGIRRILELENQVDALRARVRELMVEMQEMRIDRRPAEELARIFAAGMAGEVVTLPKTYKVKATRTQDWYYGPRAIER